MSQTKCENCTYTGVMFQDDLEHSYPGPTQLHDPPDYTTRELVLELDGNFPSHSGLLSVTILGMQKSVHGIIRGIVHFVPVVDAAFEIGKTPNLGVIFLWSVPDGSGFELYYQMYFFVDLEFKIIENKNK